MVSALLIFAEGEYIWRMKQENTRRSIPLSRVKL